MGACVCCAKENLLPLPLPINPLHDKKNDKKSYMGGGTFASSFSSKSHELTRALSDKKIMARFKKLLNIWSYENDLYVPPELVNLCANYLKPGRVTFDWSIFPEEDEKYIDISEKGMNLNIHTQKSNRYVCIRIRIYIIYIYLFILKKMCIVISVFSPHPLHSIKTGISLKLKS